MDDRFLHAFRRAPSREFAARLRSTLRDTEEAQLRFAPRAAKWAALAASVAVVCSVVMFPSVRAGAQAFLDLFRVVNFAAVSFDPASLQALAHSGLDLPRMLGEQVEVLEGGGEPVAFATPEDAAGAVGMTVLSPAYLPVGLERTAVLATSETAFRVTADTAKLQSVLDALAITDVSMPTGLDGGTATVRIPPVVSMTYAENSGSGDGSSADGENGDGANGDGSGTKASKTARLLQARTPEVSFPAGVDLAALAEIGLRVLGLERAEAYRFAQSIDWRSTLIVPVPASGTFREVDVQGRPGLMITSATDPDSGRRFNQILWSSGDRVFALMGGLGPEELLEMAQTVQ
jgi:hypothetical protein